jgi:hypothetical protein
MTFARNTYRRVRVYPAPIPLAHRRNASMTPVETSSCAPIDKENAPQHAGYMDLVRALPCAHCGKAPRSQFCHSDEGKGMGIKSDCRLGWPGCPECHDAIGTHRVYPRHQRRALEAEMARQTRALIEASGLWPKNLPKWSET